MRRDYRVIDKLGEGGYGQVFRIRLDDGRIAALKQLAPRRLGPRHRERLRKEAELALELAHPNIVSILDVCEDDAGAMCLIMELVDGLDLAQLAGFTRLPVAAALYIGRALLSALVHAHEVARIVHRDVSPHNVLISWDGDVKLTDFGSARTTGKGPTRSGAIHGKLRYMSPEQYNGMALDARSDLFAVGLLMYQLIAGCLPHGDSDDAVIAFLTGHGTLEPLDERCPEVSPTLHTCIMGLLRREPDERYQSARQALEALPEWPHGHRELAIHMRRLREVLAPRHPRKRGPGLLALAATLVLGAALGTGATRLHTHLGAPPGDVADTADTAPDSPAVSPAPAEIPICPAREPSPEPGPQQAARPQTEHRAAPRVNRRPPRRGSRRRKRAPGPSRATEESSRSLMDTPPGLGPPPSP